jgi:hypothetical protein
MENVKDFIIHVVMTPCSLDGAVGKARIKVADSAQSANIALESSTTTTQTELFVCLDTSTCATPTIKANDPPNP